MIWLNSLGFIYGSELYGVAAANKVIQHPLGKARGKNKEEGVEALWRREKRTTTKEDDDDDREAVRLERLENGLVGQTETTTQGTANFLLERTTRRKWPLECIVASFSVLFSPLLANTIVLDHMHRCYGMSLFSNN